MSNALCVLLSGPPEASAARAGCWPTMLAAATTAPAEAAKTPQPLVIDPISLGLMAVGICVLTVWIISRIFYPKKLSLARTPGRSNTLNPLHVVLILLLWMSGQLLGRKLLSPFFAQADDQLRVVLALLFQCIVLAGSLVVASIAFPLGLRRGMGLSLRHWLFDSARGVVAYFAVLPMCLGALWLCSWMTEPAQPIHEMLKALLRPGAAWKAVVILLAVVVAPVAEEVFFRGVLQSMIRRYTRRPWPAILIASALFGLAHFQYWHTVPALFCLGVALGYNYERCGRLISPILTHAIFNGVSIVIYTSVNG